MKGVKTVKKFIVQHEQLYCTDGGVQTHIEIPSVLVLYNNKNKKYTVNTCGNITDLEEVVLAVIHAQEVHNVSSDVFVLPLLYEPTAITAYEQAETLNLLLANPCEFKEYSHLCEQIVLTHSVFK